MSQIIRLTEEDIHNIVKESVVSLLKEGYSGKHFIPEIDKHIPLIIKWREMCNNNMDKAVNGEFKAGDEIKINLKPFNPNGEYMQQKFTKNSKIKVSYHYLPEKEINYNVFGITSYQDQSKMSNIKIDLYFNKKATEENLRDGLVHEITHALDFRIGDWKGSWMVGSKPRTYNHQFPAMQKLPNYVKYIMYWLWDTAEFQAWQSSLNMEGGFDNFVNKCMNYLEQANADNNEETWLNLKEYLIKANKMRALGMIFNSRGKKDFSNVPTESVKKYFIKTSFKKLKKFIKKAEI